MHKVLCSLLEENKSTETVLEYQNCKNKTKQQQQLLVCLLVCLNIYQKNITFFLLSHLEQSAYICCFIQETLYLFIYLPFFSSFVSSLQLVQIDTMLRNPTCPFLFCLFYDIIVSFIT